MADSGQKLRGIKRDTSPSGAAAVIFAARSLNLMPAPWLPALPGLARLLPAQVQCLSRRSLWPTFFSASTSASVQVGSDSDSRISLGCSLPPPPLPYTPAMQH